MYSIKPTLPGVAIYVLVSALAVIFLRKISAPWIKSSLITAYFCLTLAAWLLWCSMRYAVFVGVRSEWLRQSCIDTAEAVRILTLLGKANAAEADPALHQMVTNRLNQKIDWLLPIADNYLADRGALRWRLQDAWVLGDVTPLLDRDIPGVLAYRAEHPGRNPSACRHLRARYAPPATNSPVPASP